jgi:hypothetical protein
MPSFILTFVPFLLIGAIVVFTICQFLSVYQGSDTRRSEDVSHRDLPVPIGGLGAAGQLMALGFSRLGETETRLPVKPYAGIVWHFSNAEKTITAEMTEFPGGGILLNFYSVFYDGSIVETGYPAGENIHDRLYRSQKISSSLEDAYRHQLDLMAQWSGEHGSSRRIETMAELLHWEELFRANFAKRKLMASFTRGTLIPLFLLLVLFSITAIIGYGKINIPWPILISIPIVFAVFSLFLIYRMGK